MAYPKRQAGFVSQFLQFDFEQAHARTIGTAAIRRDHQLLHVGIALSAHDIQPASDRIDRELCRVVADAKSDASRIGGDAVNSIRADFPKLLINEIMHVDLVGTALPAIIAAAIFIGTDRFLLLGVNRNHRLTGRLGGDPAASMCSNCAFRSGLWLPSRVLRFICRLYFSKPNNLGILRWSPEFWTGS